MRENIKIACRDLINLVYEKDRQARRIKARCIETLDENYPERYKIY